MTTKKVPMAPSISIGTRKMRRCAVCDETMTVPHKALSLDGMELCDACYQDRFFADMTSHRHLALDHCTV